MNHTFLMRFMSKHREGILYLFFGGIAFFLNIFLFWFFRSVFAFNELIANVICWIICVIFQFFTNKIWVFCAETTEIVSSIRQFIVFVGGRVATLLIEEIILAIFITWLNFNDMPVKIAASVFVIIGNYVISKFIVFKKS